MGQSILQPSWGKSTKSTRYNQLKHFFAGRNVLDVGCAVGYQKDDWVHKNIKSLASTVYGIDLDKRSVDEIRRMGYAVEPADAQDFNLGRKFDLIHAGELIEHLDNPGGFLESARRHLLPEGILLLTTPNALRVGNFIYASTGGLKVNNEHTCWFCETTLKTLLERKGFEVVETGYLKHETYSAARKVLSKIVRLFLPERVAWNTLYVVAKLRNR